MELILSSMFKKELEGGYSALCPELGVASQGETIEEAKNNLREAVELYLESAKDLGTLKDVLGEAGIIMEKKKKILASKVLMTPLEATLCCS